MHADMTIDEEMDEKIYERGWMDREQLGAGERTK
jgi:hypothetical protein